MRTDELDFELPPELIAQEPAPDRAASRLMHYRRDDRSIAHRTFAELPRLLRRGDLLVFNDARVLPARFMLEKPTGGRVEGLFLNEIKLGEWDVLLKNLGGNPDVILRFVEQPDVQVRVVGQSDGGQCRVVVTSNEPAAALLGRVGRMPLPPYIKREKGGDERDAADRERYQTVYAAQGSAVAAPTAGLHFTQSVLDELDRAGVERAFVTLNVGLGTFKPVTVDDLSQHAMHGESYTLSPSAADALNRAKAAGRRIVAVGTTSARVLECQPAGEQFHAHTGQTSIFIFPPYEWKHVGALLTNFHLPRSTLVALVAALTGLDEQRRMYRTAIQERYRFFSYGDAMLIE
jgi:S-adenosylmethionine:tRNA ribosyltransferase-isomerase